MTTENSLKTLKDIMFDFRIADWFMEHKIAGYIAGDLCGKIQLFQKQEAIKWVKKEVFCDLCEDDFMKFFNITEEDLK